MGRGSLILMDAMNAQPVGFHRLSEFNALHYAKSDAAKAALSCLPHISSLEGRLIQDELDSEGIRNDLLECAFRPFQRAKLHRLLEADPDCIILPTKFYFSLPFLKDRIEFLKKTNPRAKIVVEGQAASFIPRELVHGTRQVDRSRRLSQRYHGRQASEFFPLVANAGCEFRCSYCWHHDIEPEIKRARMDSLLAEIRANWEQQGIYRYWFQDAIISGPESWAAKFFSELASLPFSLEWIGNARVEHLNASMASAMKKSGCVGLFLGIENGDPSELERMGRPHNLGLIRQAVENLRREEILSSASWLVFGEQERNKRSLELAVSLGCDLNVVNSHVSRENFSSSHPGWENDVRECTREYLKKLCAAGVNTGLIYDIAWASTAGLNTLEALRFFRHMSEKDCSAVFQKSRQHAVYAEWRGFI